MLNKLCLLFLLILTCAACNKSLNTLDGPSTGTVSGLVCSSLPLLSAALESPISRSALVSQGQCMDLNRPEKAEVIRTVMMPADGKYSQFTIKVSGKIQKLWIQTSKIRN